MLRLNTTDAGPNRAVIASAEGLRLWCSPPDWPQVPVCKSQSLCQNSLAPLFADHLSHKTHLRRADMRFL